MRDFECIFNPSGAALKFRSIADCASNVSHISWQNMHYVLEDLRCRYVLVVGGTNKLHRSFFVFSAV